MTGSFTLHGHLGTQAPSTLWPLLLQSLFQSLTGREQSKGKTHLLLIHSEPKRIQVTSNHLPFMNINCTVTPRWQVTVASIPTSQQQADIMRREHRSGVVSWLWAHLQPLQPLQELPAHVVAQIQDDCPWDTASFCFATIPIFLEFPQVAFLQILHSKLKADVELWWQNS